MIPRRPFLWLLFLAVAALARTGHAHPVVVYPGTVRWDADTLAITLIIDEHNLEHESAGLPVRIRPALLARMLGDSIEVHTASAVRLSPATVEPVGDDENRWRLRHDIPAEASALALRHRVPPDPPPGAALPACEVPRQIQLSVLTDRPGPVRMIRLTAAGNHEVILRPSDDPANPANDPASGARLTEPHLRIAGAPAGDAITLAVEYPATVLAAWPDLVPIEDATLRPTRLADQRDAIAAWARRHLHLPEGAEPASLDVSLIDPLGEPVGADARASALTTRVAIEITIPLIDTLRWTGFTDGVLRVNVEQRAGDAWRHVGALNPSTTAVRLDLGDPMRSRVAAAAARER